MANIYWSLPAGWEGQWSTAGSPIGKITAPPSAGEIEWYWDPNTSDAEKIQTGKDIIAANPESTESKDALRRIYSIIRRDFRENILGEKDNFFNYLKEIQSMHPGFEVGNLAYKYMVLWKMLEGDNASVINLSNEALKNFSKEDKNWALVGLVLSYTNSGLTNEARVILNELRANSADNDEFLAYLESDIANVEHQIAEGQFKPVEFVSSDNAAPVIPELIGLEQNYPNPFNPTTQIRYSLIEDGLVTIKIHDVLGREIATLVNEQKPAGTYYVDFNASGLSSGIYFYTITARKFSQTKKMVLLR